MGGWEELGGSGLSIALLRLNGHLFRLRYTQALCDGLSGHGMVLCGTEELVHMRRRYGHGIESSAGSRLSTII